MRLLLDECVPRGFARELAGLDVRHVTEVGWKGVKNGRLLGLACEAGFHGIVTVDANIARQHPIHAGPLFLIVLRTRSSRLADLRPLSTEVLKLIGFAQPGQVYLIEPR
jgi:predicted nuclease of predicted toxin-antitoxin system